MNKMKIFPDSVINQSYEQIISEHNKPTRILYLIILVAVILVFASMFFIYIDVGVSSAGVVKPIGDNVIVISPVDGILKFVNIKEDCTVSKGDTLFRVIKELRNLDSLEVAICANIDGKYPKIERLVDGSQVKSGQQLIEISPNGELQVQCYIKSQDIGLLREGLACHMQIDSYNYNQWGMIEGELIDISDEAIINNQGSFYKAYCSLNGDFLELKNGYKGYLKKGMNVKCRFVVNRRSLFELLYDKVENWINPLNNSKS